MIDQTRRVAAYLVFASLCFYFLLPFKTGIPGFSTFTLLKLGGICLAALSLPAMFVESYRRAYAGYLRLIWPALTLAGWMCLVSLTRRSLAFSEAKLMLGFAGAAYLLGALSVELRDRNIRNRATYLVLVLGFVGVAAALLEPLLSPSMDPFWRMFRPYLPVWNPVLGKTTELARIHWIENGQFRIGGLFSDPNHFANFLNIWFPLLAGVACVAWRKHWVMWVGAIVLAVPAAYAMGATLTRSAVLAAGLGAFTIVWSVSLANSVRAGRSIPLFTAISGVAVLAGVMAILIKGSFSAAGISIGLVTGMAVFLVGAGFWGFAGGGSGEKSKGRIVFLVGVLGMLVLAAIPANTRFRPVTSGRLSEPGQHAVSWRASLWELSARILRESPVIGIGYTEFYRRLSMEFWGFRQDVSSPHNLYLSAAVSGGIVALGLLIHYIFVLFRLAFVRALRKGPFSEISGFGAIFSWYWLSFGMLAVFGQDVFPVDEALTFFSWSALTIAWLKDG